ncbi:MAG: DUF2225 domain-containing protein [Clostridia bacterium]|nr:DUF2225 domain-containing protein [Clostridia bacterium]
MLDVNTLRSLGSIQTFREDDFIFYEGEQGNEMYLLLSGKVDIFVNSFDANPFKIAELKPGDFFGEMSVLDGQPRSASAVAATTTVVLGLTRENFEKYISAEPSSALRLMKGLCLRIRNLNAELSKCAEESREQKLAEPPVICPPLDIPTYIPSDVFPEGHRPYSLIAPDTYAQFVYDKEVKCPLCKNQLNLKMQRLSKLKLDHVEPDFRQKYVDFEPLWFTIWLCPHCNYANFYYDFESITDKGVKALQAKSGELRNMLPEKFSGPLEINKVFTSYYIALYCAEIYGAPPLKIAKLWMQISWLYKDMEDMVMYKMASSKALEFYHHAYYNFKLNISVEQEQQLSIILGELYLLQENTTEAIKCFHNAINRAQGKPLLNQQAQSRVEELRNSNASK